MSKLHRIQETLEQDWGRAVWWETITYGSEGSWLTLPINPFELPLLNTVILLSSGITVTRAHHSLIQGNRRGTLYGLVATVFLALVFTGLQAVEYNFSTFSISDGAFGSCFYFATGFHGLTNVALFIYLFITFLIKPSDPLDTTKGTLFKKRGFSKVRIIAKI